MTAEQLFGELRTLLHQQPGTQTWEQLCALFDQLDAPDETLLTHQILPYAEQLLTAWPSELRVAPPRWTTPLALRNDPELVFEEVPQARPPGYGYEDR